MKTIITSLALIGATLLADSNTDWVDAQIQAIKPPRTGVSSSAVNATRNPFLYQYKKVDQKSGTSSTSGTPTQKTSKPQPLQLFAVMNNSALISGNWYKIREKVRGYTVSEIQPDSVMLEKGSSKKMLFVTNANNNIKIQVK